MIEVASFVRFSKLDHFQPIPYNRGSILFVSGGSMKAKVLGLFLALLFAPSLFAQEKPQAFIGARILPIVGEEIPRGTLVVHQGKILTLGPADSTSIPEDAVRHEVEGLWIMAGLVDTHSHIGGGWGADSSAPIQPEVRILDSFNVRSASVQRAQAGGITVVNVMPGSGHLLSGQTLYLKLRDGETVDDLLMYDEEGKILSGIKMANGTNSQKDNGKFPGTRSKSAALVRENFIKAQEYQKKLEKGKEDPSKMPERDLAMESLVEILSGKIIVHHHTHRHDDILTVLRLAKEFGFRVVLHHVSEGWRVAPQIKEAGAPCSIILVDSPGGKIEAKDLTWETGAILEKEGVLTAFHTDDWINDSRFFFRSAALAVRAGMSREKALYGLTMAGAKMIDLEQRVGSLEVGKDADFILLNGDPLSVYTKVVQTWIDGEKVFDWENPEDRLFAVGGYGANHDRDGHDHDIECFGGRN